VILGEFIKLGASVYASFVNLKPQTTIPEELNKGDLIYLEGHPDYMSGLYLSYGFNDEGQRLMYPIVDLKDMTKYFRKEKLL